MKKIFIVIAFAVAGMAAKAQSNTPDPSGHAYGLYHHFSAVSGEDISSYLIRTGHTAVTTPRTEDAGRTWTCITIKEDGHTYNTTVYTDGNNIVDFDDSIVD